MGEAHLPVLQGYDTFHFQYFHMGSGFQKQDHVMAENESIYQEGKIKENHFCIHIFTLVGFF